MKLALLGFLLGLSYAKTNKTWDFDYHRCDNMKDPECVKFALTEYNYTVDEIRSMTTVMRLITERRIACKLADVCPTALPAISVPEPCANGQSAGTWACDNIDLLAFVPLTELGSGSNADGNDIWGWTNPSDPLGGTRRYIFTGQTDGSSIVDITDAENPQVLCFIPSQVSINTVWRDIKVVYNLQGTAFAAIVADRSGQGLQFVPLEAAITKCRNNRVGNNAYRLVRDTDFGWIGSPVYTGSTNTHNIVGSDESIRNGNVFSTGNRVYLVGSGSCSGGLLPVNFNNVGTESLLNPRPAYGGCYSADGYTHDAECWLYSGPDAGFQNREICVGYNENSVTIVDFTNLNSPQQLSRTTYSQSRYTHQGWRSTDQRYLLMNDELDESRGSVSSQTTYVLDISNLRNPVLTPWASGVNTIDHNLYIKQFCSGIGVCNDYAFESNYRAGLRIIKLNRPNANTINLGETGYFKTWQGNLAVSFNGAWSSYPYFDDPKFPGLVVVQDIEQGLFVLDACDAIDECGA